METQVTEKQAPARVESKSVVVKSRVQELAHDRDMKVSEDFMDALNVKIDDEIARATFRAKGNGRKTLQPQDL